MAEPEKRSRFRNTSGAAAPASPEELWYELRGKRKHEFLRGPQQDVLREYLAVVEAPNIAMELAHGHRKDCGGAADC
jgi:hypothetical protein